MLKRGFIGDDIFKAVDILNKIDLNFEELTVKVKENLPEEAKEELKNKTGLKFFKELLKELPKVRKEVNDLLGGLCEISSDEMGKKPLNEYIGIIKEAVTQEDFSDFLSQVGQLIN